MAFTVTWKPNEGLNLVLNSEFYPIDGSFSPEVEFSDPSVRKMQRHGEHPTFGYMGALKIALEGHIFGVSKLDFWNKRMAFLKALTPPNRELTSRRHGTLVITDSDAAEPMQAYCRIINRTAILDNLSPERCPYLVTFKAFEPYLVGVATGKEYVVG